MSTPHKLIPSVSLFLLAGTVLPITAVSAATWDAGGGGDTSLITEANWSTAFTSTGNIDGVDYFGYNNQHADVNGAFTLTLGDGEWFRQDTSIAGYQTRLFNVDSLTISSGARLTAGASISLQGGTIIQDGGLVEAGNWALSQAVATSSSYTLNDGTMNITGPLTMQPTGTNVSAVFTQNSGDVTVGGDVNLQARNADDVATLDLNGGTMTVEGTILHRENLAFVGTHNINVNAGSRLVVNGGIGQVVGNTGSSQLNFNFNGGTLATRPTATAPVFGNGQVLSINADSTFRLSNGATQNVTVIPELVLDGANLNFDNQDPDNLFVFAGPAWNSTGSLSFEGANDAAARFQFQGGGNTYSGGTTINSGYVRLNAGTTFDGGLGVVTAGGLGTGTITFGNQGDSTLLLNYTTGDAQNAIQVDAGSNTNTIITTGARSANMFIAFTSGGINLDGDLTIDNQGTGIHLVGQVTGNGTLIANDGILQMQAGGNTVGEVVVQSGAELRNNGDNLSNGTRVTVNTGGLWSIGGKNFNVGSIAGDGGDIIVQVNRGLTFGADNTDSEFAGVLSSVANDVAGSVYHNKVGSGTTTLSGNNTFEQYMNVGAGTLKLGNATALGATTKEFDASDAWTLVQGTGSLDLNGLAIGDELIILRSIGGGNGGLINSGASGASLTGTVRVDSDTLPASIDGIGAITLTTVDIASSASLSILSDVILASGGTIDANFTVGASGSFTAPATPLPGTLIYTIDGGAAELIDNTAGGSVDITNLTLDVDEIVAADGDYTILSGSYTGASFAAVVDLPTDYTLVYNPTSIVLEAPVTATAFDTWATGFSLSGGDELPGVDVENDGLTNLEEFVFGGDPTLSEPGIAPAAVVSGTDLVFTFKRSDESEIDGVVVIVQTNTDLTNALGWDDSATIGATDGTGYTVSENGSAADDITVTIPMGTDTEKFARVRLQ